MTFICAQSWVLLINRHCLPLSATSRNTSLHNYNQFSFTVVVNTATYFLWRSMKHVVYHFDGRTRVAISCRLRCFAAYQHPEDPQTPERTLKYPDSLHSTVHSKDLQQRTTTSAETSFNESAKTTPAHRGTLVTRAWQLTERNASLTTYTQAKLFYFKAWLFCEASNTEFLLLRYYSQWNFNSKAIVLLFYDPNLEAIIVITLYFLK